MPLPLPLVLDAIARLAVGVLVVLWWLPAQALPRLPGMPRLDRVILGGACAALALVVAGYALAAAHLYEWMVLVAVLALGTYAAQRYTRGTRRAARDLTAAVLMALDDVTALPRRAAVRAVQAWDGVRRLPRPSMWTVAVGAVAAVILGVAVWMRWWMNLTHAAPLYSDFVVVLAWVKHIEEQHLFPDGVYLKGFHLVAAGLQKLTLARPELFLKFAGPAVGVGMVLAVAFFAYRATGSVVPALFAALVYGTLPSLLPYEVARQAATDSQEFGNMLVLPAAWFVYRAWTRPKVPAYRFGAAALLTLIATVHPLAILNAGGAACAATVAAWVETGLKPAAVGRMLGLIAVGAVVAVVPPAVGLAVGAGFYASSAQFAGAVSTAAAPAIAPAVWAGLGCAALAACLLPLLRRSRAAAGPPLMALLLLAFAVAVQQAPRLGLHSAALMARAGEMAALAAAPALAMGWVLLEQLAGTALGRGVARWLSLGALVVTAAVAWALRPPQALNSYRMDSDGFVATYERILHTFPNTDWLAVSDRDGYDYTFGYGFFLDPQPFIAHVAPRGPWPSYRYADGHSQVLGEHEIFLFVDKQMWVAPLDSEQARVPAREAADQALADWITAWRHQGGTASVFFDGPYLRVYEISRPQDASATLKTLFGGG